MMLPPLLRGGARVGPTLPLPLDAPVTHAVWPVTDLQPPRWPDLLPPGAAAPAGMPGAPVPGPITLTLAAGQALVCNLAPLPARLHGQPQRTRLVAVRFSEPHASLAISWHPQPDAQGPAQHLVNLWSAAPRTPFQLPATDGGGSLVLRVSGRGQLRCALALQVLDLAEGLLWRLQPSAAAPPPMLRTRRS